MKISTNQTGASHLVLILVVAVTASVGVIGYRVANQDSDETFTASTTKAETPDSINSNSDVYKADAALDQTAVDSEVNPSQLDGDIDSLL